MPQCVQLRFRALIKIEEFIIAACDNFFCPLIDIQASCLAGNIIPCLVVKGVTGKVEGRNRTEALLFNQRITGKAGQKLLHILNLSICVATLRALLFIKILQSITDGNYGKAILAELQRPQLTTHFHRSVQIKAMLVNLRRYALIIAVSVNLVLVCSSMLGKGHINIQCILIHAGAVNQLRCRCQG